MFDAGSGKSRYVHAGTYDWAVEYPAGRTAVPGAQRFKKCGTPDILVSSGAIGMGAGKLSLPCRPNVICQQNRQQLRWGNAN